MKYLESKFQTNHNSTGISEIARKLRFSDMKTLVLCTEWICLSFAQLNWLINCSLIAHCSQPQRSCLEHPPVYPQQAVDCQLLRGPFSGGALGKLQVVTHRHPPPGEGEPRCSSKYNKH